jgi:hypothetical protein
VLEILAKFFVQFLAWLAPFTLRKLYPPQRIANLVKIQIASDSDGIEYWGGEVPQARAWISITNLSPFPVEIDRAFGAFAYSAYLEKYAYLQREKIMPATEQRILIETSLSKEQAAVVHRLRGDNPRPSVEFNALFLCRVNDFQIHRRLETTHHRLVNFGVTA